MSTGSGGTSCTTRPGVECEALGNNYVCGNSNRCEAGSFLDIGFIGFTLLFIVHNFQEL